MELSIKKGEPEDGFMFAFGERTNWARIGYGESMYEFIDRSAWPICGMIRDWVNSSALPFKGDNEFLSRFRSKYYKHHSSAVMELLLYGMFKGLPVDIQRVERNSQSTPDFVVHDKNGGNIFLECVLAASAIESDDEKRRKDGFLRWLEKIPDFPFFVGVEFNSISEESISKKELYSFLKRIELSQLSPTGVTRIPYNAQGWDLVLILVSKNNLNETRTMGMTMSPAKAIDNFTPLMAALGEKKPARYSIGNDAYIICVGIDDPTANQEEFFLSLFGAQDQRRINLSWKSEGFFLRNGEHANTSVSAVIFCKNMKLTNLTDCRLYLWHNPFAAKPVLNVEFPCIDIRYELGDQVMRPFVKEQKMPVFELLGIDGAEYEKYMGFKYCRKPDNE